MKSAAVPVPGHQPADPPTLVDFDFLARIGDGLAGTVYLVRWLRDQRTYAIKAAWRPPVG